MLRCLNLREASKWKSQIYFDFGGGVKKEGLSNIVKKKGGEG